MHVPDYGSSHVAVKQHESREGTREKDQDDKTSQSLSAKNIYMRRKHLICNVIKKLAGFAFIYRNVPAGSRSSCSEISVSRSLAQQTPSVYQKTRVRIRLLLDTDKIQAREYSGFTVAMKRMGMSR